MKKLTCTQCGAPINNTTLTCDYCGSVFFNSSAEEVKPASKQKKKEVELEFDVRSLDDDELARLCSNIAKGSTTGNIFVLFFMIVWTSIAFTILSTVLVEFASEFDGFMIPFLIVPSFFVFIGLSVIVKIIIATVKGSVTKEVIYIKRGEYQKAYESFTTRENKKHNANLVGCLILLNYFKLSNFAEAKQMIIQMPQKELASLISRSSVFVEIAQNLGVRTPAIDNSGFRYFSGYTTTL